MMANIHREMYMRALLATLIYAAAVSATYSAIAATNATSLYSNIRGKACTKHIDDKSTRAYTLNCPGVYGFRLHIMEDDQRSSVDVITPDNRSLPLDYWDTVTQGFSSLGNNAEWRIATVDGKAIPIAVIVRVIALDQTDPQHPKRVPLLAVAKIHRNAACVTHIVSATTTGANEQARKFADAEGMKCISGEPDTK